MCLFCTCVLVLSRGNLSLFDSVLQVIYVMKHIYDLVLNLIYLKQFKVSNVSFLASDRVRLKGEPASLSLLKKLIGLTNLTFQAAQWAHSLREKEIYHTNSIPKLTCQKGTVTVMCCILTTKLFKMELFKDLFI